MLIDAQTEDGNPLRPRQIHDETLTLLLAGHETTALALSWTWYLLAHHPEVDATMQAELQTVLGGRLPTAEDLPQLRYTRMVFTEALRLYPPAWLMTRRAREEVTIGNYLSLQEPSSSLSPYLTHRDARFFPDWRRSSPRGGRPHQTRPLHGMPISPLAGGRASVSAKGLRGWKGSSYWRRWPRRGACSSSPARRWSPGGW